MRRTQCVQYASAGPACQSWRDRGNPVPPVGALARRSGDAVLPGAEHLRDEQQRAHPLEGGLFACWLPGADVSLADGEDEEAPGVAPGGMLDGFRIPHFPHIPLGVKWHYLRTVTFTVRASIPSSNRRK